MIINPFSIIIPVYNEEKNILNLYKEINQHLIQNNIQVYEIIFVDDGSTDRSSENIEKIIKEGNYNFTLKHVKLNINSGKGKAIRTGIKNSNGKYILLQDADLELDIKDAKEMYEIISTNKEIKCIFGSRYLSGKLKKNNYFLNNLVAKLNSLIFNIFFLQSLSDVHCGLKIFHRSVLKKINLTVNDFGIEIDLTSQVVRNKF